MNYIVKLVENLSKSKVLYLVVFILILVGIFSYNNAVQSAKLECINGHCRVLQGETVTDSFETADIKSCSSSIFRRYCLYSFAALSSGRKCYYPEIRLNNGRRVALPYKFDSKYKSSINAFCENFRSNKDFIK